MKSDLCVQMKKKQTIIKTPEGKIKHRFKYDHCFWSHDGFEDEDGYAKPEGSNSPYADQ